MEDYVRDLPGIIFVGLGATLLSDIASLFLDRAFTIPRADFCLVGRWILHMASGRFSHPDIAAASPKRAECAAGWLAHYAIGIGFAAILVAFAPGRWLENPTLSPAIAVGLATVVFPLLVLQPCFGFGIAASKTARPARARLRSLMTHTIFGLALFASAQPVSSIFYARP